METRKLFVFLLLLCFGPIAMSQNLLQQKQESLAGQWDLCDKESNNKGLFFIKRYKPVYVLLGKVSNNVNQLPHSDSPDRTPTEPLQLNKAELEFQLSLKTKIFNDLLGKEIGGDLWVGYTQVSFWQVYNSDLSRPFRETNYEPEVMFILPVGYNLLGIKGVFAGVGFAHQSNGRSNPYSRSWNRIVAQFAFEGKHSSLIFKPWMRLSEPADIDDNPGIEDYVGRCELLYAYRKSRHNFSCVTRHSLRLGNNNRGSIQLDYAIRIIDNLKFHTQFFSGYGESLIDFNHRQTVIGFGLSLVEW